MSGIIQQKKILRALKAILWSIYIVYNRQQKIQNPTQYEFKASAPRSIVPDSRNTPVDDQPHEQNQNKNEALLHVNNTFL